MFKKRGIDFIIKYSKSQAAIFIIVALMVILSGVLYFFYQRQAVEQELDVVQPEIAPVKLYVENCMKSAAEEGLETIGLTGGYIDIPESIRNNPSAYLPAPALGFRIPYWWRDGIESVPTLEFINRQLASHVQSGLKSCINNFEPFESRFEVNELSEPAAEIQFNENDVSVRLKYQLEVVSKDGNVKRLIQNFNYILPVRFRKVYELAKLIMERENADYFLEKKTIDLYSMDTGIPTTDMEATCSAKTWQLSSIKEKLQRLLRVNLPYIRIKGTDYDSNSYVPNPKGKSIYADTYFQHHYIWEIDRDAEKKFKNMKVTFAYENWPMDIFARPSSNGILRSNSQKGADVLSFFCLHIWHFTYDIEYPVLAAVIDQETEKNKAYRFSFPFKVAVNHNQPNRQNAGITLFDSEEGISSDEYCNDVQNEITIFTVSNATGEDIRDVNLTFICGRFYCNIGASDWLSFGAAAGLSKRLPYCVNGIIKGAKKGYSETKSYVQTDVDGRSYVLAMNPVKEFRNYRIIKHRLSSPGSASGLSSDEKASILIKGKDSNFESFAVYPKESDLPISIPEKDAAYEVTIYLYDSQGLVGGYSADWKVSREMLKGAEEIAFHAVEQGPATDDERALFIAGLSSYSKNIPQPELK